MLEKTIPENKNRDEASASGGLFEEKAKAKFICCVLAAADKKAEDLVILDLKELSSFADYFVVCHGQSKRQVRGIADHIYETMSAAGYKPLGIEGLSEEAWVLMDYGELIVHVFLKSVREFYDLERLWSDAPRINIDDALSSK